MQVAGCRAHECFAEATLQAVHQRLGFGIAEADIELEDLGPVGGHHEAGVEEAGETRGVDGGFDDGVEDSLGIGGGQDAAVAIGAHASGVGTGVAIEDGFMILGGCEAGQRVCRR